MIPIVNDAAGGGAAGHIRYSISELMKIGDSAESKQRPKCYDCDSRVPWKHPDSPKTAPVDDEKEKTRKTKESRDRDVRSDRRIGSGRIFDREAFWDNKLAEEAGIPSNPPGRRERILTANEWLERRGMSSYRNHDSIFDTNKSRNEPIRRSYRDDTEPEWFSAGPTSKFDVVELHGFEDDCEEPAGKASSTPVKMQQVHSGNAQKKDVSAFNMDKYLDSDYLTAPSDGGSRFSQWFSKCIPKTTQGSHPSIFTDLENIMNDSQSTDASDGAARAQAQPVNGCDMSKSVKDFMQMANTGVTAAAPAKYQNIASVNDIETSLRDCAIEKPPMFQENSDMAVFRNFVANMPNDQLVGAKMAPPFLPDNSATRPSSVRWAPPTLGSYVELLQRVISYAAVQKNRQELLYTPEAQESLQALMRGEMSVYHMLHHLQLVRPGREQEIIIAVLWAFNQASQLVTLPRSSFQVPPYSRIGPTDVMNGPLFPSPGQNPAAASFSNGKPQRMPSARELHFHTQSIMQNALMRKKLEEQMSGFVNHPGAGQSSPARQGRQQLQGGPSSFTFSPTSVMCKIVGDKEAEIPPPKEASEASII